MLSLKPIQLDELAGRISPTLQMCADTKWHHDVVDTIHDRLDGFFIQVVVMVVRNHKPVNVRQVLI